MSFMSAPPKPPTALGVHRPLSSRAGVRVSPLQLGAMSIGDKWTFMGFMNKQQSFALLDAYFEAGGNFIDTANSYQDQTSEQFVGEWIELRGVRDQIVLATKYTTFYKAGDPNIKQRAVDPAAAAKQRIGRHRERERIQGFVWNQDLFVPPYIKDRYVASTSPPSGGYISTSASSTNTIASINDYEVEVVEIRVREGELEDIIP
ncbi:hypothetical protein EWM64_g2109 [Hericium alpestre]|uniref:NADP-dependent oxidoreductase domain-containing protein n=1 Tax=Hericium alpestre TaxID=135208 RepID=A0A4Z0A6C0_9AGAM|nr:hypothetical protein EWM64_g2109 [Hericium alpestre]